MGRPKGSKNKNLNLNEVIHTKEISSIIIFSKKHGRLVCWVDREDYEKVSFTRWQVIKRGKVFHVQSCSNHNIYIHRIILNSSLCIDHINGDGLDNRKSNLREATKSQNAMNICKEKFKGVLARKDGRFQARIVLNKKQIHLGIFKTQEDAARAYNEAAIKYFGKFARLNKIED